MGSPRRPLHDGDHALDRRLRRGARALGGRPAVHGGADPRRGGHARLRARRARPAHRRGAETASPKENPPDEGPHHHLRLRPDGRTGGDRPAAAEAARMRHRSVRRARRGRRAGGRQRHPGGRNRRGGARTGGRPARCCGGGAAPPGPGQPLDHHDRHRAAAGDPGPGAIGTAALAGQPGARRRERRRCLLAAYDGGPCGPAQPLQPELGPSAAGHPRGHPWRIRRRRVAGNRRFGAHRENGGRSRDRRREQCAGTRHQAGGKRNGHRPQRRRADPRRRHAHPARPPRRPAASRRPHRGGTPNRAAAEVRAAGAATLPRRAAP